MKRNHLTINPVIAVLIFVFAAAVLADFVLADFVLADFVRADFVRAGAECRNARRQTRADEQLATLLDRLYYDQRVSSALKLLHHGDTAAAARVLDVTLCTDVVRIDSETALADSRTRESVLHCFGQIGRTRPELHEPSTEDSTVALSEYQMIAQDLLAQAAKTQP